MNRRRIVALVTLVLFAVAPRAFAQLTAAKDGPIVYGHHHLNVTSIDDHKKFWVDTLGGTPVKIGTSTTDIIRFPNVFIFLRAQAPKGSTKGSSVNHIGFSVPNLRAVVDRIKANGYRMVTPEEAPAGVTVKDDIGQTGNGIAYALGPDDVKVELLQVNGQTAPIQHHHTHFFGAQPPEMLAWYAKVFGAKPRTGAVNGIIGADLPGGGLSFSPSAQAVAPTQGRALDHVGFEVRNLEEFCKTLEAQGITLAMPLRRVPALNNLAIAF